MWLPGSLWRDSPTRRASCDKRMRRRNRGEKTRSYLVSVLAGGGNTDSARPVVVEVGELVGQLLQVLRLQPRGVPHHVVAGGIDGALLH